MNARRTSAGSMPAERPPSQVPRFPTPIPTQASAQRLAKVGMPIEEYPQTVPNLTAATSNLFDLIQSRSIALYSDAAMRLGAGAAVAPSTAVSPSGPTRMSP